MTFTTLWANSADEKLTLLLLLFFFFFFLNKKKKTGLTFHANCLLGRGDNLQVCQSLFLFIYFLFF